MGDPEAAGEGRVSSRLNLGGGAGESGVRHRVAARHINVRKVADIDAVHEELRGKGVREGLAPITLGEVARISMILDPDGNWIELSRRASTSAACRRSERLSRSQEAR